MNIQTAGRLLDRALKRESNKFRRLAKLWEYER